MACTTDTIKHHAFGTVTTPSGGPVVADQQLDTLDFVSGHAGLTIVGDAGNDRVTFNLVPDSITHDILSAAHLDATTATVVRGDLIVGQQASPKWERLAIGTSGKFIKSDGTDVSWATLVEADISNLSHYTHPNHTGDVTSVGDGATTIGTDKVLTTHILNANVTLAKIENFVANSILARGTGAGVPNDMQLADFTEEASPAALDFCVGFLATGELRKFDLGNLPGGGGGGNSFETIITDPASETLTASASDQLTLKEGSSKISIDGVASTDIITFDVIEANIDHDALTNFVTAEHVDWAGAGAGTIHIDNYIEGGAGTDTTAIHDNVANEITAITAKTSAAAADEFVMEDSAASFVKKAITFADLEGSLTLGSLGGTLPIGSGGTNSTTALGAVNGRLMVSDGSGAIVETGNITVVGNVLDEVDEVKMSSSTLDFFDSSGNKVASFIGPGIPNTRTIELRAGLSSAPVQIVPAGATDLGIIISALGSGNVDLSPVTGDVDVTAGNLIITSGRLDLTAGDVRFVAGKTIQVGTEPVITLTSDALITLEKATTITAGDFTVTAGDVILTLGDLTLTAGNVVLTLGNLTLTSGDLTLSSGSLAIADGHAHFGTEEANSGGNATIDWTKSNKQNMTLSAASTLIFTAPGGAAALTLRVIQDSTARIITWPGDVIWTDDDGAPDISTVSKKYLVFFYFDGTNYYGGTKGPYA